MLVYIYSDLEKEKLQLTSTVHSVTSWSAELYQYIVALPSSKECYDYSKFITFLTNIIENEKCQSREASKTESLNEVSHGLKILLVNTKNTYDGVLISILLYLFKHKFIGNGIVKSFSLSDTENVLKLFNQHIEIINDRDHLNLQIKLIVLATNIIEECELVAFLKHTSEILQSLKPPLEQTIRDFLNEYFITTSTAALRKNLENLLNSRKANHMKLSSNYEQSKSNECVKVLNDLGLLEFYEHKLQLQDFLCIRSNILELSLNGSNCSNLKQLPFLILQKLMSYDILCLSDLVNVTQHNLIEQQSSLEDEKDDYVDSDEEIEDELFDATDNFQTNQEMHPVDSMLALLLCCDDFLRQDLFSRLAKCQLAIPFIMPDPVSNKFIVPIWAMRSIIIDWVPSERNDLSKSYPMVTCPMPIISFIRFGKHQDNGPSKSLIMNKIMSEEDIKHFFYRDLRGGKHRRIFGEGLVDMSWYLPSGKPLDIFSEPVIFLNLHGDAHKHPQLAKFLSQISSVCFVLLVNDEFSFDDQDKQVNDEFSFDDQDKQVVQQLYSSKSGLILLNGVKKKPKALKNEFPKSFVIDLKSKSGSEINDAIRIKINSKLKTIKAHKSIEECVQDQDFMVKDEDNDPFNEGKCYANKIMELFSNFKGNQLNMKEKLVPLQGKHFWQSWAADDKELHRQFGRGSSSIQEYSAHMENEKKKKRDKQYDQVKKMSPMMSHFIEVLLKLGGDLNKPTRNYFLQCLKLSLNSLSRENVHVKQQQYKLLRKQVSKLPDMESESPEKKELLKKIKNCQNEIIESSFGLEHLFREIGQIYEATHSHEHYKEYGIKFSKAVAELLLNGYPLEVMDGDAAHVPIDWISAVLSEVKELIGNQRVFVLSILGLQSTGKSTMLNTTFGLQFNVSAGRCTRGAFLQIVPLDEDTQKSTNCKYLLIIDTEGLRAPELDQSYTQKHDNELATFVIGIANMTLINIYGEVPGDIDDILQTSVHAFLRMN